MPLSLRRLLDRVRISLVGRATQLVTVTGSDRHSFLTRVMSGDLPAEGSAPTALLGPRGNLRAVGTAVVLGDRIHIECDTAGTLAAELDHYRITDDVEISVVAPLLQRLEGMEAQGAELEYVPGGYIRRDPRPWPSFVIAGGAAADRNRGAAPLSGAEVEWLRIAAGEPRWGSEADQTSLPLQSGFQAYVRLGKGCYIGQEYVARQAHRGRISRELRGVEFDDRRGARPRAAVHDGEHEVGTVTSVATVPLGTIGLALVSPDVEPGTRVRVGVSAGIVTALPFPTA